MQGRTHTFNFKGHWFANRNTLFRHAHNNSELQCQLRRDFLLLPFNHSPCGDLCMSKRLRRPSGTSLVSCWFGSCGIAFRPLPLRHTHTVMGTERPRVYCMHNEVLLLQPCCITFQLGFSPVSTQWFPVLSLRFFVQQQLSESTRTWSRTKRGRVKASRTRWTKRL